MFRERGGWWVAGQAFLLTVLVVLVVTDVGALATPGWLAALSRLFGAVLVLAAIVLGFLGARDLGPNLTPYPEPMGNARLVETGIYGKVRHPLYGAVLLGSMGIALIGLNPAALGVSAVVGAYFVAKARHEEKRLVARYPGYAEYRSQVRRWFVPWVA